MRRREAVWGLKGKLQKFTQLNLVCLLFLRSRCVPRELNGNCAMRSRLCDYFSNGTCQHKFTNEERCWCIQPCACYMKYQILHYLEGCSMRLNLLLSCFPMVNSLLLYCLTPPWMLRWRRYWKLVVERGLSWPISRTCFNVYLNYRSWKCAECTFIQTVENVYLSCALTIICDYRFSL